LQPIIAIVVIIPTFLSQQFYDKTHAHDKGASGYFYFRFNSIGNL